MQGEEEKAPVETNEESTKPEVQEEHKPVIEEETHEVVETPVTEVKAEVKEEKAPVKSLLCVATLYQKNTVAVKGKGAQYSETESKEVKPAATLERAYVEYYNKTNTIGRYFTIDEEETQKRKLK